MPNVMQDKTCRNPYTGSDLAVAGIRTTFVIRCRWFFALAGVIIFAMLAGCTGQARTESDAAPEPAPSGDSQPVTTKAATAAEPAPDPKYHLTLTLDVPSSIKASRLEKLPCDVTIRNSGKLGGDKVAMFGQALWFHILIENEQGDLLSNLDYHEAIEYARPSLMDVLLIPMRSALTLYKLRPLPLVGSTPRRGESVVVYLEIKPKDSPGGVEGQYPHLVPWFEEDSIRIWKGPALQSAKKRVRLQ